MRCDEISTAGQPAHRQLESWQSWYGSVFQATPLDSRASEFVAHHKSWNVPGLSLNWVSAPALAVVRTKTLIRREPIDHWAITLGSQGMTLVDSPGTQLAAPAGLPFVVSLGQEMKNQRGADERIQLYLSRDVFYGLSPVLDACCMTSVTSNGGRLLADYMAMMLRNLPTLPVEDAARLVDATRAMLAACLAPSVSAQGEAQAVINVTMMDRVRQVVRRSLKSPRLGVDLICREVYASRSQIYRLLQGEGGVARYIQKLRLAEGFALLCDGSRPDTIEAIAESLCFSDASTFARAFRREFGVSPSDVRLAAQSGLSPATARADNVSGGTFAACLRAF